MTKRDISLDGSYALVKAREAIGTLNGVIGTDILPGLNTLRVWQDSALTVDALAEVLTGNGIRRFSIR